MLWSGNEWGGSDEARQRPEERMREIHKKSEKGQKDQRGETVSGTHWEEIDQRKEMGQSRSPVETKNILKKSDAMGEKSEVAVSPIILYPASLLFHLDT